MYLKEKLQNASITDNTLIKVNFYTFGMCAMVPVSGIFHISTGVPNSSAFDTRHSSDQVLHAPKTSTRQHGSFVLHIKVRRYAMSWFFFTATAQFPRNPK